MASGMGVSITPFGSTPCVKTDPCTMSINIAAQGIINTALVIAHVMLAVNISIPRLEPITELGDIQ